MAGYWSELLLLSLSFCLLTEPVLRTFLYNCRMAHDDGGFWCNVYWKVFLQESEKDDDRTMNVSIEPFTRLILCMTTNVEFKTLPTFLHHRFCAWYVSPCHGRNLQRTIKSGTLSKQFHQFVFKWYINHFSAIVWFFSRYNDSLSARFFNTL